MTFWTWISLEGASLAIMQCYKFHGIDVFSSWVTVWVLWRVETRFQKAFRDIGTIWSRGLKLNRSSIIVFRELAKVYLGMENVIGSSNPSRGWYFWNWPLHVKFASGLTEKTNSFLYNDLLTKGKLGRGTIVIMKCYEYDGMKNFVYPSHRLGITMSWNSPSKGF